MEDLVIRLLRLADLDSRAGEPLGECMREAAKAIKHLRQERDEETATVARVWKALGISTYEEAGGREISGIVSSAMDALVGIRRAADHHRHGKDGDRHHYYFHTADAALKRKTT